MPASYRFSAIMILARSMATSRALCAGRASVLSCGGEVEAGCCAFSRELSGLIEKLRATHVRSFKFIAKPPDATALVGWILCFLIWLLGVLLASPKDTKYALEKTFFLLLFRLCLTFRSVRRTRILCFNT